jgi:hypothetical protein
MWGFETPSIAFLSMNMICLSNTTSTTPTNNYFPNKTPTTSTSPPRQAARSSPKSSG